MVHVQGKAVGLRHTCTASQKRSLARPPHIHIYRSFGHGHKRVRECAVRDMAGWMAYDDIPCVVRVRLEPWQVGFMMMR